MNCEHKNYRWELNNGWICDDCCESNINPKINSTNKLLKKISDIIHDLNENNELYYNVDYDERKKKLVKENVNSENEIIDLLICDDPEFNIKLRKKSTFK